MQTFTLKPVICFTLFVVILLTGCSASRMRIGLQPAETVQPSGFFQAGAAKIDITPPPGYPMGGYAIAGKFARGWWTRLFAKTIYLEDNEGQRLILVSCDLWSMPAGLGDRVVEILQTQNGAVKIGREHLLISATHTFNSPGNFSSCRAYNLLASPDLGFDKNLFEFMAQRIASCITSAVKNKQPAKVSFNRITLPGISRNRSITAFNLNSEKDEIINLSGIADTTAARLFNDDAPHSVPSADVFQAIDPTLSIIKISKYNTASESPIAVAAFFAVHPTAMGPQTEVYSSDLFGVAAQLTEQYLRDAQQGESPVVAIFNGAEGDVSPNWKRQDRTTTMRLGEKLTHGIIAAVESATEQADLKISHRFETIELADRLVADIHSDREALCVKNIKEMKTGAQAYPGLATLGGAEDGRSLFYGFGFREGYAANTCDPRHGYKFFAMDKQYLHFSDKNLIGKFLSTFSKGKLTKWLPQEVPISINTIGSIVIASLPGEFTVTLGYRINETLKDVVGAGKKIILVGLANEYLSYFTTPLEYNAQHYEGASTMYGQFAGLFVEQEFINLAKSPENTILYKLKRTYDTGAKVKDTEKISAQDSWNLDEGLANILQNPETGSRLLSYPFYEWQDKPYYLDNPGMNLTRVINPQVKIEVQENDAWEVLNVPVKRPEGTSIILIPETDTNSLNLVTVIKSMRANEAVWQANWLVPKSVDISKSYRFTIKKPDGQIIHSELFKLDERFTAK